LGSYLILLGALLVLTTAHGFIEAGWLKVMVVADKVGPRAGELGSEALEHAVHHLRVLPAKSEGGAALAAQATQEGHWRFANRAGETLTAGTPHELTRVAAILLPDAKANERLSFYVTADTVFEHPAALKDLPTNSEIFLVAGEESYLIESTLGSIFAQVPPGMVIELRERKAFEEAVWQLARPFDKTNVRVLALEPGGPPRLSASPRIDPTTQRAMVDVIDPASLSAALGTLRGQTVLVTGRVDARLLYVKPESGAERSILLSDLFRAAEDADVNLMVLRTAATPRQPGGRNWLWQKVEVRGLEEAMQHPRLADFLNALVGTNGRMTVSASPQGKRTALEIRPVAEFAGPRQPVGAIFTGIMADITGRVNAVGLEASVRSAAWQQELEQRLIPGIPANVQGGYLAFIVLGLCGLPISRAWWRRLWPPEAAPDYAGRGGYWAARTVRAGAFLFLFLPLTALVAAPLNLVYQVREAAMTPARLWRRLTGQKTLTAPG
jgi:hypothetical protein